MPFELMGNSGCRVQNGRLASSVASDIRGYDAGDRIQLLDFWQQYGPTHRWTAPTF